MLQTDDTKQKLAAVEHRIRALREERARALKLREAAKQAYAAADDDDSPMHDAAMGAVEAVKAIDGQLEKATEEQTNLLRRLGDAESGMRGLPFSNVNGWNECARTIDLQGGVNRADIAASALLRAQVSGGAPRVGASLRPEQVPGPGADAPVPAGPYYAYQCFPRTDTAGEAAVTDFTVEFTSPTVTGMERAPAATTTKPVLPATYALATPQIRQHAIVAEDVPVRLLDSGAFGPFLDTEARRQVDLSVDRHVLAQIAAANPPSGSSGSDLISKVRNAVAASRAFGSWPSVLLLSPEDSSALDLTQVGADDLYLFLTRDTGSSSPVWSLRVIESAAVDNPLLLDPGRCGALYVGAGSVTVDDLTGLKTNTASIRTELEALLHVRCAQAAYEIV